MIFLSENPDLSFIRQNEVQFSKKLQNRRVFMIFLFFSSFFRQNEVNLVVFHDF